MSTRLPAARRRRQLLDVARRVFAERGFHDASMNDIAIAAGVTKPVLYQHFASKRELFAELLGDVGRDLQEAITKGVAASNEIFAEAWSKAGYQVVTEPGPDVLRIKTGIVNIWVSAPDNRSASRSHTFAAEAGVATFFLEARDSLTGALLGRAVDQRFAGDTSHNWRTSVSYRADFRELVESWAGDGVRGLGELKSLSPIRP